MYYPTSKIRNLAVIAHVDHGKTTLMDALFKQANLFHDKEEIPERAMDSYELEKERGITIFAKHTGLLFNGYKINLIDTPGHADFSGEVERVLGMVNSVLLLIDAGEGPMPQTRFVLSQSLKAGLKPIIVVNKIDKRGADPHVALDKTFDLFVELGATDAQLDFSYCFVSALQGYAIDEAGETKTDLTPLFRLMADSPEPTGSTDRPFLMQVSTLSYDEYLGREVTGRILEGTVKKGETLAIVNKEGSPERFRVLRINGYLGLDTIETDEAGAGDIVSIAGAAGATIGDTLCDVDEIRQLPAIRLGNPTLSVEIGVNSGPFAGKEGTHVTMNKIRDRLLREKKANISLKIEEPEDKEDIMSVSGRGELHLSVLMERMRREGFEFLVSRPEVITKTVDGILHEPIEKTHIEVPDSFTGGVIEELTKKKGELNSLQTNERGITSITFFLPTRSLIGYRGAFTTFTKGLGILTSTFHEYAPFKGDIPGRQNGVLIATSPGMSTPYACFHLQGRGTLFIGPRVAVYEGMIVGENHRENDLHVNITREKQLTNIRSSATDEHLLITSPRKLTLEEAINYIQNDELVEITPKSIRLRKKKLLEKDRKKKSSMKTKGA
ncbi:MAG: translational GTPase TypA [Simkaniaceae bacterium]|nr:translational GTPase TypA [Simkaniaceae bacterium]